MHGQKNIPSANPLFSGITRVHPILHVSKIRVKIIWFLISCMSSMSLARVESFINYSYILAVSNRLEFFMDVQLVVIHYFYRKWFGVTLYPS